MADASIKLLDSCYSAGHVTMLVVCSVVMALFWVVAMRLRLVDGNIAAIEELPDQPAAWWRCGKKGWLGREDQRSAGKFHFVSDGSGFALLSHSVVWC